MAMISILCCGLNITATRVVQGWQRMLWNRRNSRSNPVAAMTFLANPAPFIWYYDGFM